MEQEQPGRFTYDDVSTYTLDDEDEAKLIEAQNECTFMWATKDGWPVGVIMSYVWRDGAFWLSVSSLRVRVAAVERDPRVSVCISSKGTDLRATQAITYKGHCEVFSDDATKAWLLPALAERLRPDNAEAQAQFVRLNDTPNRRVLKVTPLMKIGFDGRKMAAATRAALERGTT